MKKFLFIFLSSLLFQQIIAQTIVKFDNGYNIIYKNLQGKTIVKNKKYTIAFTDTISSIGFVGTRKGEIVCINNAGKELFEVYPQFATINGGPVGIRSVSKKFDSLEDFYRFYGKTIRWKSDFHNHIIELVKWANENNILNTTLANFVIDHKWEELEALKNGELVNVNFDAVKIV